MKNLNLPLHILNALNGVIVASNSITSTTPQKRAISPLNSTVTVLAIDSISAVDSEFYALDCNDISEYQSLDVLE